VFLQEPPAVAVVAQDALGGGLRAAAAGTVRLACGGERYVPAVGVQAQGEIEVGVAEVEAFVEAANVEEGLAADGDRAGVQTQQTWRGRDPTAKLLPEQQFENAGVGENGSGGAVALVDEGEAELCEVGVGDEAIADGGDEVAEGAGVAVEEENEVGVEVAKTGVDAADVTEVGGVAEDADEVG